MAERSEGQEASTAVDEAEVQAAEADDVDAIGAFAQMCRSIRQTLALQARLARHVRREGQKRTETRKAGVRPGLKQLIWTEYEPAVTPELEARLERLLDAEPETFAKGSA